MRMLSFLKSIIIVSISEQHVISMKIFTIKNQKKQKHERYVESYFSFSLFGFNPLNSSGYKLQDGKPGSLLN